MKHLHSLGVHNKEVERKYKVFIHVQDMFKHVKHVIRKYKV